MSEMSFDGFSILSDCCSSTQLKLDDCLKRIENLEISKQKMTTNDNNFQDNQNSKLLEEELKNDLFKYFEKEIKEEITKQLNNKIEQKENSTNKIIKQLKDEINKIKNENKNKTKKLFEEYLSTELEKTNSELLEYKEDNDFFIRKLNGMKGINFELENLKEKIKQFEKEEKLKNEIDLKQNLKIDSNIEKNIFSINDEHLKPFEDVPSLSWPIFHPLFKIPFFDMETYQKVNLDVQPSAITTGEDLPLNDINTLRFFFNFGVQHAKTILYRQHNNAKEQLKHKKHARENEN